MGDILSQGGMGSLNIGQDASSPNPMPTGTTSNPMVDQLLATLVKAQQGALQQKARLPQQLPPIHSQAGDVSGMMVNPSTIGGPAHNARVSMAQTIGNVVSQALNRHEDKEARDLSFDIQTIESAYNTLNDPNATPQEKQMATQQLNTITSDKGRMKKIQKALNIQFFGGEDKRTNVEKKAVQMAGIGTHNQGGGQQQQAQPQQQQTGLNPQAQQLMQRMPSQLGTSPATLAAMEMTKSGMMPSASDLLKYASDQQYYKVMEDKMGKEAATKMAQLQEKYQKDAGELWIQLQKEQDRNKQSELLLKMRELHENNLIAMHNMSIDVMRERLEGQKDSALVGNLYKASKATNDQIKTLQTARAAAQKIATKGIFGDAKAKKDVADLDEQIKKLEERQTQIGSQLDAATGSPTQGTNPELDQAAQQLLKKYGL